MDRNRKDKILSLHVKGGCVSASRLLTTFASVSEFADVSKEDIDLVLSECTTCQHISNHVKPRKSSPGVTLARELTTTDCIFIDHKQMLGKDRISHINESGDDTELFSGEKSVLTIF